MTVKSECPDCGWLGEPHECKGLVNLCDARATYFRAGGIESDVGQRRDPTWYWRRAAKLLEGRALRRDGLASPDDKLHSARLLIGAIGTHPPNHGCKGFVGECPQCLKLVDFPKGSGKALDCECGGKGRTVLFRTCCLDALVQQRDRAAVALLDFIEADDDAKGS